MGFFYTSLGIWVTLVVVSFLNAGTYLGTFLIWISIIFALPAGIGGQELYSKLKDK